MHDEIVVREAGGGQNPMTDKLHNCKQPPLEMNRVDRLCMCCWFYRSIVDLACILNVPSAMAGPRML